MPNLEDFLGKNEKKINPADWEEMSGTYGCQQCDADVNKAFFNQEELKIVWFCPQRHESKIELG
jgi:hypothetical protein